MITMTFKSLARSVAMSGLIGLGALLTSGAVLAQELKIGYVNSERVLREAAPAKAAGRKAAKPSRSATTAKTSASSPRRKRAGTTQRLH